MNEKQLPNVFKRFVHSLPLKGQVGVTISIAYYTLLATSVLIEDIRKSNAFVIEGWVSLSCPMIVFLSYGFTIMMMKTIKYRRGLKQIEVDVIDRRSDGVAFYTDNVVFDDSEIEALTGDSTLGNDR